MDTKDRIKQQIETNRVFLYMKGTPQFPMCGFSAKVAAILKELDVEFGHVNVLEDPDIRATLPVVANWATFPQLYVNGELIGGCDIVSDMYENSELQAVLEKAKA